MSLYKLVTIENVDLNYKAFKKDELIDCILNLRTTYFRLKKENEENKQLKDNWNKLKEYLHNVDVVIDYSENYDGRFINYDELIDKMQEIEQGSDSNENNNI